MSDNLTIFKGEYEKYKGQFVLSHDRVYRFLGLIDDGFDYYWCLYDGRKIYLNSCVGRLTPLKGYILEDHYEELIRIAKINHWDSPETFFGGEDKEETKEFNINHKIDIMESMGKENKWLEGPNWEIN